MTEGATGDDPKKNADIRSTSTLPPHPLQASAAVNPGSFGSVAEGNSSVNFEKAGLVSRILVSWLSPLLSIGYRRPLELSDMPYLGTSFQSATVRDRLNAHWIKRKPTGPNEGSPFAFLRACFDAFGGLFYFAGLLKFIGDWCGLLPPLLVKYLIEMLKRLHSETLDFYALELWYGLGMCFLIFALCELNTLCVNNYFTITMQTGMKVRSATSTIIYEKSLKLSGKARQQFSSGQVINLMSTDAPRLETATSYLHYLWSGPFQIIVIVVLLFRLVSWAAFVGFGTLIVFLPIQSKAVSTLSNYRKETSKLSDKRVKLMQEIIHGIRVVKFYAWERSFLGRISEIRQAELSRVSFGQTIRSLIVVSTNMAAVFSCIFTFLVYYWQGNALTAEVVFPTLALFAMIRVPLILLPMVISFAVDGRVSMKRIQSFLLAEEIDYNPIVDPESPDGIALVDASFEWDVTEAQSPKASTDKAHSGKAIETPMGDKPITDDDLTVDSKNGNRAPFSINNVNIAIPKGSLVAIVGPVGCGKSSFLSALVGEMRCTRGEIRFGGTVAYCPQQAWIQNATVRDNILFGNVYDATRYQRVIEACALKPDFAVLPDGDHTEIGEKGVNLSGGQKQRISLARAAYADADVLLLDDPLSAVDAHVGKHLLRQCIKGGLMAGKTRILVTHQLHLLPLVDLVIVMDRGEIIEVGTYSELVAKQGTFTALMKAHGGLSEGSSTPSSTISPDNIYQTPSETKDTNHEPEMENISMLSKPTNATKDEKVPEPATANKRKKLTAAEDRSVGAIKWSVYRNYFEAAGGIPVIAVCLSSVILWNVARVLNDYWVSDWTNTDRFFKVTDDVYVLGYLGLGILQTVFAVFNSLSFSWGAVKASRVLHNRAAHSLLYAPVSFYDVNPTGRIINRLTKDQDALDNSIAEAFRSLVHTFANTFSMFTMMVLADYFFLFPLVILLAFYYYVQGFYRASSRELKRIDAISRSPYFAQFGETLTGLATIRAFGSADRFRTRNGQLLDTANRTAFIMLALQRWLGIRMESIGNLITFSSCLSCFIFKVPPSLAGLTITYSLGVIPIMNWCIRQYSEAEALVISAERIGHYATGIPQEAAHIQDGDPPSKQWPTQGQVEFKNLSMQYRSDLPPVLQGITATIRPGERVGIVGRTGAGKSSILQSLFRIVEASEGSILIDGIDIATLVLDVLRSHLSIIPQDPVVFAGTVRWNLDPTETFDDASLWAALERAHLKEAIVMMEGGLDATILEGGENLSVGQRQLLCLARAILRHNRILVLDEATANIDFATDALIQASIRRDFGGCTILTIAHRILTVIDYDRIMVLEDGQVKEFDTPRALLFDKPDSLFASLVRETGEQSEALLKSLVK